MSRELREAAATLLSQLTSASVEDCAVRRLTVEVRDASGNSELVTLVLDDTGALRWSTTGPSDGPHLHSALSLIAPLGQGTASSAEQSAESPRRSWVPAAPSVANDSANVDDEVLAGLLDDLVTVVVRMGSEQADAPSITEALERLRQHFSPPLPLGMSRWMARLQAALGEGEVDLVASLLAGAAQFAAQLRATGGLQAKERTLRMSWLGPRHTEGGVERLSDRALVEIGREYLASAERIPIERRYLVDLRNGEIFREEFYRQSIAESVGPCPRHVVVGLADVHDSAFPRHIRFMQYAVSVSIGELEIERIESNAYRRFSPLVSRYRTLTLAHPGQAEPVVVVSVSDWSRDAGVVLRDDEGQQLVLESRDGGGIVERVGERMQAYPPRWIAGHLVEVEGRLRLYPLSIGLGRGAAAHLMRLR